MNNSIIFNNFKAHLIMQQYQKSHNIRHLYLIKLAQAWNEMLCLLYSITQHWIYRIDKNSSGKIREQSRRRYAICAISREHYRGYEINRCEEDQIRKRRSRYNDSGIIAHGGYVELSRKIWTRGSGFGVGVRSWASRRGACESNWIFDGGGRESGRSPLPMYQREFPHEDSRMTGDG